MTILAGKRELEIHKTGQRHSLNVDIMQTIPLKLGYIFRLKSIVFVINVSMFEQREILFLDENES